MGKLTFIGHSCFYIETATGNILIDPFLSGNPLNKTFSAKTIRAEFILVTHAHGDHLGDAIEIAIKTGGKILSSFEITQYCSGHGCQVIPAHIGGKVKTSFGEVKLTQAFHGSAIGEGKEIRTLGFPVGFLVKLEKEDKVIYHAGDTGLFGDMKLIGELNRLDIALLPIGDTFTMGIEDAVKAVEFLRPALAIPMHYNTFDLIKADPEIFSEKLEKTGRKVRILKPGESMEI